MPTSPSRPGPARRPAQAVTSARPSQEDDRRHRMRSYLIAMGIRTLSFPVAIWAFLNDQLVLGWVFVVMAVLIPSVAVGLANAVDRRGAGSGAAPRSPVQGLGPAGQPHDAASRAGGTSSTEPSPAQEPIVGTVVTSRDTAYPTEPGRPPQ